MSEGAAGHVWAVSVHPAVSPAPAAQRGARLRAVRGPLHTQAPDLLPGGALPGPEGSVVKAQPWTLGPCCVPRGGLEGRQESASPRGPTGVQPRWAMCHLGGRMPRNVPTGKLAPTLVKGRAQTRPPRPAGHLAGDFGQSVYLTDFAPQQNEGKNHRQDSFPDR